MKKTRILSLLLSAVMVLSALPIAAAAAAPTVGETVTAASSTAVTGATAATANDAVANNGNYALFVGNRVVADRGTTGRENGLKIVTPVLKAGQKYTLDIDFRMAVDGSNTLYKGLQLQANKTAATTTNLDPRLNLRFTSNAKNTITGANNWANSSNTAAFAPIDAGMWKQATVYFTPETDRAVTIEIYASTYPSYQHPFYVDNITIVGEGVNYSENFESGKLDTAVYSNRGTATVRVEKLENYIKLTPDTDAATDIEYTYTYSTPVDVNPGIYEIVADARFGYFYSQMTTDNAEMRAKYDAATDSAAKNAILTDLDNLVLNTAGNLIYDSSADIGVSVKVGGAWKNLGTTVVNTDWNDVSATFAVIEPTTVEAVKFTMAAVEGTPDNVVELKNYSLAFIAAFDETLNFDDAENLLDGVTASYSGLVRNYEGDSNGYASMVNYLTDGGNNPCIRLGVDTGVIAEQGRVYYTSFKARLNENATVATHSARAWSDADLDRNHHKTHGQLAGPASDDYLWTEKDSELYNTPVNTGSNTFYQTFTLSKTWKTYKGSFVHKNANDIIKFGLARTTGSTTVPFDMDDVKVWYVEDGVEVVVYENGFNTVAEGADIVSYYAGHDKLLFDTYSELTPIEGLTAKIEYAIDSADLAADGIYEFTAAVATSDAGATGNASIVYTLADGSKSADFAIGNDWTEISFAVSVVNGEPQVTGVKLNTDVAGAIKYRDVALKFIPFSTVDTEDESNFLAGATVKATGANVESVVHDELDGHLNVAERTSDLSNYVTVPLNTTAVAGRTYYFSVDIARAGSGNFCVRPLINTTTSETAGYLNANFIVPTEDTQCGNLHLATKDGAHDINNSYVKIDDPGIVGRTFIGKFTPLTSGADLKVTFNRGPGFFPAAFNLDNLKVWYVENGTEVVVLENDFDTEGDISGITALVPLTHYVPRNYILVTPAADADLATIIYELAIPEENIVDGDYTFKADIKTSEDVGDVPVTVTFKYDDGTSKEFKSTVNDAWTTVVCYRNLEGVAIEAIEISYTADVAIEISEATLMIKEARKGGIPNVGIIMMLIHKNSNKIPDGYLHIDARTPETSNRFLTFNADATTKAGVKYYVSFDVRTTDNTKTNIRPIVSFNTKESMKVADGGIKVDGMVSELGMNNKYVVPNENTNIDITWHGTGGENNQSFPCTNATGKWGHFEGFFTPVEDGKAIQLIFERGPASTYVQPLDIDDVKIWYMDGETEVVVYERTFDAEGDNANITGTAAVSLVIPQ